jgi:peroxiredoxin
MRRRLLLLFSGIAAALEAQPVHWPAILENDVKLGSWAAAERVGAATIDEIEAGRLFARAADVQEEVKVRQLYAQALENTAKPDLARFQRCIARQLIDPLPDAPCAAAVRVETDHRAAVEKAEVLASEIREPAPSLQLRHTDGTLVSLSEYRGKTVVLAYWATWCIPCLGELAGLNHLRGDSTTALLAVSVDNDPAVATRFAENHGYHFPILNASRTLEGSQIPQTYVLDPEGRIRFHLAGFQDDGMYEARLGWMIEAARK